MGARTTRSNLIAPPWSRRSWLVAALLGAGGLCLRQGSVGADEVADEEAQVQARAQKAGLGPFRSSVTEHYLGIGDAPDDYRNEALKRCEALAASYRKSFQDKGFSVVFPARRLTVVTLKDKPSYAAFIGQNPGDAVGGHYDLETNRLVIFDFRSGSNLPPGVNLEQVNSLALNHESTHQLTFNTGLLDRQGDVPLALIEGLAVYAEPWRRDGSGIGATNRQRLGVLLKPANPNPGVGWIPLDKLLSDDALFDNPETVQLAYAEAWVFVHYLLKTPTVLPKFRAYLDAIRPRRGDAQRLADVTAQLGDLDRLDAALRNHARRLIRGG